MTPDEARTLLSLNAEASSAQRLEAHARLKGELETKLGRAPTEGLKAKYRETIAKLDQAIEVLELAGMGADLPSLAPSTPSTAPAAVPAPAAAAPAAAAPAMTARPRQVSPPSKAPTYVAIAVLVVIAVGAVGWFMQHQSTRRAAASALTERITALKLDAPADEIRSVAGSVADFPTGFADDHQAQVKAAWTDKEKALGARATQIAVEEKARAEADAKRGAMAQEDRLNDAKRRLNTLTKKKSNFDDTLRDADRAVSDLKSAEREMAKAGGWQVAYLQQERAGSERFLAALKEQQRSNPVWVALDNARGFVADKKAEAAEQELTQAEGAMTALDDRQAADQITLILNPLWKHCASAWLTGDLAPVTEYLSKRSVSPAAVADLRSALAILTTPGDTLRDDVAARLKLLARVVGEQDDGVVAAVAELGRRETVAAAVAERKRQEEAAAADERKRQEAVAAEQRRIEQKAADIRGARTWANDVGEDGYGLWADLTVTGVVQRMRYIAPGTFSMGSPAGEADRSGDEVPHTVTLTKGYWLADSECTQGLWQAVMGTNPAGFTGDTNRPVEQVSWREVQGFLSKLNGQVRGGGFVLPTEAQWEYACRAGTQTPYAGASLDALGWYGDNSGNQTHAVKQKSANAWGLFDMHGNVWEWCSDWLGDYAPGAVSDPIGPASGSNRVNRGGSWYNIARFCRSADRNRFEPGYRNFSLGFRLCAQSTP